MGIEPTERLYDVPPVLKTGTVTRAAFTPEVSFRDFIVTWGRLSCLQKSWSQGDSGSVAHGWFVSEIWFR